MLNRFFAGETRQKHRMSCHTVLGRENTSKMSVYSQCKQTLGMKFKSNPYPTDTVKHLRSLVKKHKPHTHFHLPARFYFSSHLLNPCPDPTSHLLIHPNASPLQPSTSWSQQQKHSGASGWGHLQQCCSLWSTQVLRQNWAREGWLPCRVALSLPGGKPAAPLYI